MVTNHGYHFGAHCGHPNGCLHNFHFSCSYTIQIDPMFRNRVGYYVLIVNFFRTQNSSTCRKLKFMLQKIKIHAARIKNFCCMNLLFLQPKF